MAVYSKFQNRNKFNPIRGQSLMEVLIAVSIGVILITATVAGTVSSLKGDITIKQNQTALDIEWQLLNKIKSLSENNWNAFYFLPTSTMALPQVLKPYYLTLDTSPASVRPGNETVNVNNISFTRYFYTESVSRNQSGDIVSNDTSGSSNDPSTLKVIVSISWPTNPDGISISQYLTRSQNNIMSQGDWSGGPGQEFFPVTPGVLTTNNKFASTTNFSIDYSSVPGSIRIKGLKTVDTTKVLSIVQTDDSNSASGFNLTGASFVNAKVSGTGVAASVVLVPALVPWTNLAITSAGNSGVSNSELRLGSDGLPRIIFTYSNSDSPIGKLKFIRCLDVICSPGKVVINDIDNTRRGGLPLGFALASDDTARISYTEATGLLGIKFAICNDIDCASVTTHKIYNQSLIPSFYAGSSLALGTDGNARITFNDAATRLVAFAECLDRGCVSLTSTTLGVAIDNGEEIYNQTIMAPDGFARLTFVNSDGSLRFVKCQSADCTVNTSSTPWNDNYTYEHSLTLDNSGNAMIALHDIHAETMQYVHCLNDDCSQATVKKISDTSGDNRFPSLAKDSHGLARIVNGNINDYSLRFKQCLTPACGPFLITDPSGRVTSTIDAPPGVQVGGHDSFALGSGIYKDRGRVSYFDITNGNLKYAYQAALYSSSGIYNSGFIGVGSISSWGTISWTQGGNGGTITMKARTSNSPTMSGAPSWDTCSNIAKGAALATGGCVDNTNSYIQYQATFYTSDPDVIPTLDDATITFTASSASQSPAPSIIQTDDSTSITGFNLGGATFFNTQVVGTGEPAYVALLVTKTLDNSSDVGQNSSLAMGSDRFARIAYLDATNSKLKYIHCLNIACSQKNTSIIDDAYPSGSPLSGARSVSLRLGSDGNARFTYLGPGGNKFAECTNADCTNVVTNVLYNNFSYWNYVAADLALDSSDNAFIVTNDEARYSTNAGSIIAVKCSTNDCSNYSSSTLRTGEISSSSTANFSIQMGTDDNPRIAMNTLSTGGTFVECTNADCTQNASSTFRSPFSYPHQSSSMFLDSNNYGQIVYYEHGYGTFHYISCRNADCSVLNDALIPGSGSWDGIYPSVAVDSLGLGRIANGIGVATPSGLKFNQCLNITCSSLNSSVKDAPVGANVGIYNSIGLGADAYQDLYRISYYDYTNKALKYAYEASYYTGTYTSGFIDSGGTPSWGTISWTQGGNGGTITMKARTSNSPTMSGAPSWDTCSNIAKGAALATGRCVTDGERYIQYQAVLSTTNSSLIPTLNDVTINLASTAYTGNLISSVFDTQTASGTALNHIMWQGSQPAGSSVSFQIASSNNSTGPWAYLGPDCSNITYYTLQANTSIPINPSCINNQRYFRYQVFLNSSGGSGPIVNNISINWSP